MKKKLNLIILIVLAGASGSTLVSNGQQQRSHPIDPSFGISSSRVNPSGKTGFQPSNAERRYLPAPALFNTADDLLNTFTIRARAIRNLDPGTAISDPTMLTALRTELSQTWEVVIDGSGETQTLAGSVLAETSDTSFSTLDASRYTDSSIGASDSSDIHRTVRLAFKFGVVRAGRLKLHIGSGSAAASPSTTPTPPPTPTPTPAPGCATFTVRDTGDAGDASPGDGVCATASAACTLRAAVQEANAFSCGGAIDIVFNLNTPNTINLNSALPDINRNVNLNGPGANLLTVQRNTASGTPNFRIFSINSGKTVAILGMTITNGRAPDGTPGTGRTPAGPGGDGGGVLNHGELTLRDVVIAGNRAGDGGSTDNLSGGSGGRGGGIYSEGNLTSDFFVFADGSLTMQGVTVSNNVAGNGGVGPSVGSPGDGGGIAWSGTTFTMSDCKVTNNSAGRDAGGMFLQPGRAGTVNLSNVSVIANNAGGSGGGINFLGLHEGVETMTNCTVSGNGSGSQGGGIANDGALIIFASTISNNFTQAANSEGGGIMNGASVAMTDSTVSGNHTNPNSGLGGGIYNYKATLAVNNSTITGNSAYTSGAVDNGQGIANNGYATGPLVPKIANTIIAGNGNGSVPDVTGYFISQGYNLIGRATVGNGGGFFGDESGFIQGSNGDQVGSLQSPINALLGPLANNGGPTQTHLLLPGSPAINAGDPNFAPPPDTDQRGFPRVVGSRIDIGSVERQTSDPTATPTPTPTATPTPTLTPTTTSVSSSINPSSVGQLVTFTATVTSPNGTPTGTVQFKDNGVNFGPPVAVRANGTAPITAGLTAGTYTITADYSGDTNFAASSGTLVGGQVVTKAPTTTIVSSSANPSDFGESVTFTAVVTSVDFAPTPTGTVQFKDNGANLSTAVTLNANASATFTTAALAVATHTITAQYSGDANFNPSTGSLSQVVNNKPLLKFSQSSYHVGEDGKFITITVNRSGDLTPAVTVDYASPDDSASMTFLPCSSVIGIASSRCDFTTAIGTLRFASGETSKTFDLLISQDTYVEGPETFPLTLSNPTGGAAFAQPADASATATIDDDDSATIVGDLGVTESNPIDDNQNFVRQHYHDFLNREPDEPGLNFWTSQITNCGANQACIDAARVSVSASFFLSIEFQQTGYYVERTYKTGFGDIAPPAIPVPIRFIDFLRDTQEVGRGVVVGQGQWQAQLDANKRAFALAFVQRADFLTKYPANTNALTFVSTLNANAGSVLTAAEQTALIASLATNPADAMLRSNVLFQIAENQKLQQQESNRAFVLMEYFGYLRRNADAAPDSDFAGFNFWLTKLNQFNGNYLNAEMVKAFLTSIEYRQRFGP